MPWRRRISRVCVSAAADSHPRQTAPNAMKAVVEVKGTTPDKDEK